ncbi:MAG: PD-(D/E)XK nuclease family protein, partial [Gimesia chilikensis]
GGLLNLPAERGTTPDNFAFKMHRGLEQRADEEETVRLLYVAVTRAADYLILSAGLPYDRKIESPWMKLLARHFDLTTGAPAIDPYLGKLTLGDVAPDQIPAIRVHHEMPQPLTRPEKKQRELKPSQFVAALEQGAPEPFPESYGVIAPRPGTLSHVSVSQLEVIDAELQHLLEPEVDQVPLNEVLSADEATQLGTITHAVIERLEPEKPEQAPPIVAAVLAEQPPQVREKLQPLVERQISAWYASELCQTLKQTRVHYRELDFLLHWPPGAEADSDQAVTVTGSIDALVQTESGDWMLFDYKTGSRMARMSAEQLIAEY